MGTQSEGVTHLLCVDPTYLAIGVIMTSDSVPIRRHDEPWNEDPSDNHKTDIMPTYSGTGHPEVISTRSSTRINAPHVTPFRNLLIMTQPRLARRTRLVSGQPS